MITITLAGQQPFPIDAAVSETHALDSEITREPVEVGSDIADNARPNAEEHSYECIVSDTPLDPDVANYRASQGGGAIPRDAAYQFLRQLRATPQLVSVEDSLGLHENVMLEKLSIPVSIDKGALGSGLSFTFSFVAITLVANERTIVRVAVPRAAKSASQGNKITKVADPSDKDAKRSSILWKLKHQSDLDGIGE